MKEAAGEANMTVITIVLIALVLAVGTPIIINLLNSVKQKSCCQAAGGYMSIRPGNTWQSCIDSNGNAMTKTDYWDADKKECKV